MKKRTVQLEYKKSVENILGKTEERSGWIGLNPTTIESDVPGLIYVRLSNQQVIRAINKIAPNEYNYPVKVSRKKGQAYWEVTEVRQTYSVPLQTIKNHHTQHEFPASDTIWVKDAQFMPFLVLPKEGLVVSIYGGILKRAGKYHVIPNQSVDLSGYVPLVGARWVLLEVIEGDLTITLSQQYNTISELTPSTIPNGIGVALCAIRLRAGQTSISREDDFVDLRWAHEMELSSYADNYSSAGRIWGGKITLGSLGKVNISAGQGFIKTIGGSIDCNLNNIPESFNNGQGSHLKLVSWNNLTDVSLSGVGDNIIFWDASGENFVVVLIENFPSVFDFTSDFIIGRVYYDGSQILIRQSGTDRWNFDRRIQMFGMERFSIERAQGLMISESGNRHISITAGVIWVELVHRFSIPAFDSSSAGTFTYWYRSTGGWTPVPSQTQINNTNWDDGTGTLNNLTVGHYGVHWVYVVHDGSVHVVYGQGDYLLSEAEKATPPTELPVLLSAYAILVGKIIVQKNAASLFSIQSPFTVTFPVSLQEGGASSLGDLNDVDLISVTQGDILIRNSTQWINTNVPLSSILGRYTSGEVRALTPAEALSIIMGTDLYRTAGNQISFFGLPSITTVLNVDNLDKRLEIGGDHYIPIRSASNPNVIFNEANQDMDFSVEGTTGVVLKVDAGLNKLLVNGNDIEKASSIQVDDSQGYLTATNVESALQEILSGWVNYSTVLPTRLSVDAPTYTIRFSGVDLSDRLSPGMKVRWTQNSTIRYGIITGISVSGSNTNLTLYCGTDYIVEDTNLFPILSFSYSSMKAPVGFPLLPTKWSVQVTNTTTYTKTSPAASTWYSVMDTGSLPTIDVPIGAWSLVYSAIGRIAAPETSVFARVNLTLSTSSSSESDTELTGAASMNARGDVSSNSIVLTQRISVLPKIISISSKTKYYLLISTLTSSASSLQVQGATGATILRAVSAYL
jgi:hypothetical protein